MKGRPRSSADPLGTNAPDAGGRRAGGLGARSLGGALAAAVLLLDQASKLWLLFVYDLGARGTVAVLPFVDLHLTWNYGISYGLFQQTSVTGRWLLFAVIVCATGFLAVWLWRTRTRLAAASLGLIIGGALGNGIDRLLHGAVADFVLLHATLGTQRFDWYVFNLADAAIVVGTAGILYESLFAGHAAKAP
jgi:signal peptidase II